MPGCFSDTRVPILETDGLLCVRLAVLHDVANVAVVASVVANVVCGRREQRRLEFERHR